MICPRCGKDNPDSNQFCGRCGLEMAQVQQAASTDEALFCYKHKKEKTHLRCGRCDRPICTKCVVIGPAGPRCKECARHNVPVGGLIAGEAKLTFRRLLTSSPYTIWIWLVIISMSLAIFRGCSYQGPDYDPGYYEEEAPRSSSPSDSRGAAPPEDRGRESGGASRP